MILFLMAGNICNFIEVNDDGNAAAYKPGADLYQLAMDADTDGFNDDVELTAGSNPLEINRILADGDINNDGLVNNVVCFLIAF